MLRRRQAASCLCALAASIHAAAADDGQIVIPEPAAPAPQTSRPSPMPPSRTASPSDSASPVLPSPGYDSFFNPLPARPLLESPLRWGPFQLRPHLDYRLFYGTQVYVRPGERLDTVRHSVSPGMLVESSHLAVDYTPTLNYYSKGRFEDHVDHSVTLDAHAGIGDWQLALSHGFSKSSQVLIETARQTETERHSTALSATYLYSEKTSFNFNLNQSIISSSALNNSKQWSTMNWVNYHLTEETTFGFGVGGGFADVETGSDMTYELIQGRVGWQPGEKLSLDLNGGIEIRQFLDVEGASDRVNPIMGASVTYRPFEQTTLSLQADRSVNTSLLQDQITENTQISAAISQRFLGHLNTSLSAGYRTSEYQATSRLVETSRSDDTSYVGVSLGTAFLQRGSVSVSYRHVENESNLEGFGFSSNQYSLNVGYRF